MIQLQLILALWLIFNPYHVHAAPAWLESRALHNVTSQNKAGLGWNNPQTTNMSQFFRTGKIGWYYTWSSWSNDQGKNLDFVPLLWGKDKLNDWTTAVNGRLKPMFMSKDITHVLGFNEPQEKGQSNMTPQEAKDLWMTHLHPLKTEYGVRLGSPATSSAPSGKNWTQEFLTVCGTDCEVDFIALHYYGTNATDMIAYITDFWTTFQKPIWVTEWACQDFTPKNKQCTQDEVWAYMNKTQTFMDSAPWLERYAWFGALVDNPITSTNDLLTDRGRITTLGQQYIMMNPNDIVQGNSSTSMSTTSSSASSSSSSGLYYPTATSGNETLSYFSSEATALAAESNGQSPSWLGSPAERLRSLMERIVLCITLATVLLLF